MRKSILGMIAIASMAIVGCTQDVEQLVVDDMKNVEFIGTIEDTNTRTSMDNTGKVIWCKNDQISIFMRNGNHYKYQANEGGTTETTFAYANWYTKSTATLGQNYAVYPFAEKNAFDASTKKFTVDLDLDEQTYTVNNFQEGKSVMTAKATNTDLPFYNALSMLNVKLSSDVPEAYRIQNIKIESNDLCLSGENATIDLSGEDGKVAAVLESGENAITLKCGDEGVVISTDPTDFYILVPVNDVPANDFKITITATDESTGDVKTTDETIAKDFKFERSKIVTYERTLTANSWTGSIEDVIGTNDIVMKEDHAEVSTAKGLLKWAYIANNKDHTYGLTLMNDVEMPAFEIEEDVANETYRFTEKGIDVIDGVPSGSNWIPVCGGISAFSDAFSGQIEGNDKTIKGLRIKSDKSQVGFIGVLYNRAFIKNLVVEEAVVNGEGRIGVVVGHAQHGTTIENVHVKKSTITGKSTGTNNGVGGIVGLNYRKILGDVNQDLAYVKNCTTDKDTKIVVTGSQVGGICGMNYGAVVINCINNADVTGGSSVGGVCGVSRDYHTNVNGYLIGSGSTAEADVKATNSDGAAGGVVGLTVIDPNHNITGKSDAIVIACYSLSKISATKAGAVLGSSDYSVIKSCWGVKNETEKVCGSGSPTLYDTYAFDNATEITQEIVDKMNQVIAEYNSNDPSVTEITYELKCPYTWSWTNESWPVLSD